MNGISIPTSAAQAVDDDGAFLALHAEAIRALLIRTKDQIIEIGCRLAECNEHIGHGNWYAWLDREFGWSVDTAENFIHVYEMSKTRDFRGLNLPISALYLLARPSTPKAARDEIFESAKVGKVAVADVKQAIAAHKTAIDVEPETTAGKAAAEKPSGAPTVTDTALREFDGHICRLLQMTGKAKPARFARTGVHADELMRLGDFLAKVASARLTRRR